MEKLRILFVIDNLQFGGGERVFAQIINGISQERYEVFLASGRGKDFLQNIHHDVKFFPLDFSKRINPALIPKLAWVIRKNKIQIVHGQGTRAEFYARLANRIAGRSRYISTIAMPVEGFDTSESRKKIYRFLDRLSEKFVDRFIVVSNVLREMMINKRGFPPEKVARIYNGIEIDEYNQAMGDRDRIRIELGIDPDTVLIGAVGRLVWQKGFEYLIKAMPGILERFPKTKLLIVGNGPLKAKLRTLGERLTAQGCLIFTGFRNDIPAILAALDIIVISSLLEGFPIITLEAMAMAKPIVATKIHGITEQIADGRSGLLIPPMNKDALTDSVIRIIENPNLAENLGIQARKRVTETFSVERMVAETERIYRSLS